MKNLRPETRHAIVLMIGTGVTTLLGLVYGVYATRRLGDGAVGTFTHALSVVACLQIAFGPINGTVAKFTAEFSTTGERGRVRCLVHEFARRIMTYGAIFLVIAMLLALPLAKFWKYETPFPLMLAMLMTFLTLLLSVARGALRGLQKFGALSINTIFEAACRLAVGLPLLLFWINPGTALVAYLLALAATLIFSRRQLRAWWGDAPRVLVDGRSVQRFMVPMFLLMLTSAGFQNIDMLFVKRLFSATEGDAYGVAFYVTGRAAAVLVTPFNILMLPLIAARHSAGAATLNSFLRVFGYFLLLAAVPLGLIALWPRELMELLYGDRFPAAATLLLPLTLLRLISHLCHLIGLGSAAMGRFRFLYVYAIGLGAQVVALLWGSTSIHQVPVMLLWTQGLTLIALLAFVVWKLRAPKSTHF